MEYFRRWQLSGRLAGRRFGLFSQDSLNFVAKLQQDKHFPRLCRTIKNCLGYTQTQYSWDTRSTIDSQEYLDFDWDAATHAMARPESVNTNIWCFCPFVKEKGSLPRLGLTPPSLNAYKPSISFLPHNFTVRS
jgi:hypothetical protein